jgi:polysaccharide export outer membrane protein
VEPVEGGRVRLALELARGVLEAVDYRPGAVTLRFVSRFDPLMAGQEADDVYRIGPDDKLRITVYNQDSLSAEMTVSSDGNITMPVLGKIRAQGLSQRDLTVRVTELLGQGILVNPQVDVEIQEYRNQWVMVTGEVRNPGRHALRGGTTLKEVLAEAMGFTEKSGEEITISRRIQGTDDFKKFEISRSSFEIGGVDPTMNHGDIVEVSRATYCYIHGEVRSPSRVPVERGMTLLKAITSVGGLTEWADRKEVRILPPSESGEEGQVGWDGRSAKGARGRVVNLRRIQAGLEPDPVLKGGEIVYVKRRYF